MNEEGIEDPVANISWTQRIKRYLGTYGAMDAMVGIILALSFLTGPLIGKLPMICRSHSCIIEAQGLTKHINASINPCDDFYEFVCGQHQQRGRPDSIPLLKAKIVAQILNLYKEPIQPNEHRMVKATKTAFKSCIREELAVNTVGLNAERIAKALNSAGGWPLLEGSNWNETKFEWLEATYRFRELGYRFGVFFGLNIVEDPIDKTKYMIQVSVPKGELDEKDYIRQVAEIMGANKDRISSEIDEIYDFMQQFNNISNCDCTARVISTVSHYQALHGYDINWLEFINKISGPGIKLTSNDPVVFPYPDGVIKVLNLLAKTPKRILANYMMWQVVKEISPDVLFESFDKYTEYIVFAGIAPREDISCLNQIQKRFRYVPNPIELSYVRRYFPVSKHNAVLQLANNIKGTFLELLERVNWIEKKDKDVVMKSLDEIEVMVGAPRQFYHDKLFDEINVDMGPTDKLGFLDLMLQLRRNYESFLFKQHNELISTANVLQWNLKRVTDATLDQYQLNKQIEIPATILQLPFYKEGNPNYLNYAKLGTFIAAQFVQRFIGLIELQFNGNELLAISNQTKESIRTIQKCLDNQITKNLAINGLTVHSDRVLRRSLSTSIAYLAYEKLEKVEPILPLVPYTNQQVFWISAASIYCQSFHSIMDTFDIPKVYSASVSTVFHNNPNYVTDFECPPDAKGNSDKSCIF